MTNKTLTTQYKAVEPKQTLFSYRYIFTFFCQSFVIKFPRTLIKVKKRCLIKLQRETEEIPKKVSTTICLSLST